MNADCKAMARRLQAVEFSMYDTMLYLDIYPECSEALALYGKLREERDALRASLAKRCRRPVSACETDVEQGWSWIDSPWPWDTAAN
jgi:spore coat protein JB